MSWPQAHVGAITIDVPDRATVLARIAAALDGSAPPAVLVSDHVARTGARVALLFGSAVDYVAGTGRRPPALARRLGAEWLVRLAYEPRRLARRYLIQGPPALLRVRRGLRPVPTDAGGTGAC